jgi:hypothetical protein
VRLDRLFLCFLTACGPELDDFRVIPADAGDDGRDAGDGGAGDGRDTGSLDGPLDVPRSDRTTPSPEGGVCEPGSPVLSCWTACRDLFGSVLVEDEFDEVSTFGDRWRADFQLPEVVSGVLRFGPHTGDDLTSVLSHETFGDLLLCVELVMPARSERLNSFGLGLRDFATGVQLNLKASETEATLVGIGDTANVVLGRHAVNWSMEDPRFVAFLSRQGDMFVGEILSVATLEVVRLTGRFEGPEYVKVGLEASRLDVAVDVERVIAGVPTAEVLERL